MAKSYLERKEAWAAKMMAKGVAARAERAEGRLPPGQHTVEKLPVLDLGIQPEIGKGEWRLQVGGAVEEELEPTVAVEVGCRRHTLGAEHQ